MAVCGDGVVRENVETCDDGNNVDTDACRASCVPARCGDGVVQAGVDECDDGNDVDRDDCRDTCRTNRRPSIVSAVIEPDENVAIGTVSIRCVLGEQTDAEDDPISLKL